MLAVAAGSRTSSWAVGGGVVWELTRPSFAARASLGRGLAVDALAVDTSRAGRSPTTGLLADVLSLGTWREGEATCDEGLSLAGGAAVGEAVLVSIDPFPERQHVSFRLPKRGL